MVGENCAVCERGQRGPLEIDAPNGGVGGELSANLRHLPTCCPGNNSEFEDYRRWPGVPR